MRAIALFLALCASLAFAQSGPGPQSGGVTRGNFVPYPVYRTPGTGAQTYFVDGSLGADTNNCTASGASACATIQGAMNRIPKLLRDNVTVNIAAGNYAGFIVSGFTVDTGIQQTNAGLVIAGALANSTLASGSATGTAAGAGQTAGSTSTFGTLCDSGATWTVNDLVGRFVTTTLPTNAQFVVSSNTATCLTIVGTWALPVAAQTTYTIQDPSVIITSPATVPPTAAGAGALARGGILFQNNLINYRQLALLVQNVRIANTTGFVGFDIQSNDAIQFLNVQMRNVTASSVCGVMGTVNYNPAVSLRMTKCDCLPTSTNASAVQLGSGQFESANSLFRMPAAHAFAAIDASTSTSGGLPRIGQFTASEIQGAFVGIILGVTTSRGVTFTANRITCIAGGTAIEVGSLSAVSGNQAVASGSASISSINTTNIATCDTAVQATGMVQVDVTGMTGATALSSFRANVGGQINFTKAGVTITSSTTEINLDSGGVTAAFSDVTAGFCLQAANSNSKVCGR